MLEALLPPLTDAFGVTLLAFLLADTVALALVMAVFSVAFAGVLWLTRRLGRIDRAATRRLCQRRCCRSPRATSIAHYLTLVIQGAIWLPSLILDPLMSLAPDLGAIPVAAVWYLSVAAIVGGHIAGVVLAHRNALRDARRAGDGGRPADDGAHDRLHDPEPVDHRPADRGRSRGHPRALR